MSSKLYSDLKCWKQLIRNSELVTEPPPGSCFTGSGRLKESQPSAVQNSRLVGPALPSGTLPSGSPSCPSTTQSCSLCNNTPYIVWNANTIGLWAYLPKRATLPMPHSKANRLVSEGAPSLRITDHRKVWVGTTCSRIYYLTCQPWGIFSSIPLLSIA